MDVLLTENFKYMHIKSEFLIFYSNVVQCSTMHTQQSQPSKRLFQAPYEWSANEMSELRISYMCEQQM